MGQLKMKDLFYSIPSAKLTLCPNGSLKQEIILISVNCIDYWKALSKGPVTRITRFRHSEFISESTF